MRSFMTMQHEFAGICLESGALFPNRWKISVDMVAYIKAGTSDAEIAEASRLATLAYQKIQFWLNTSLDNIMLIDVTNQDDCLLAMHVENPGMFIPNATLTDDRLAQLLHAKMAALSEGHLVIGKISITSDQSALGYTFDPVDTGYTLPTTVSDYLTDTPTLHTTPWWHRNDGFCMEIPVGEDGKILVEVEDPLIHFDALVSEETADKPSAPARILHVEKWSPKKL